MPDRDLIERRRAAADAEFEGYDFGSISIAAADGWQFTMPGNQVHRAIYIEDPDNPEADTVTAHFGVKFIADDSDEVADAYAIVDGNLCGRRLEPRSEEHTSELPSLMRI